MRLPPPSARFLTLSVREPAARSLPELRASAAAVTNWAATVRLAVAHGIAGFAWQAAREAGDVVPPRAGSSLHRHALDASAQSMACDAALARIAPRLAAAGLPLIVLKGPALAECVYPSAALRPYRDVDLLVRRGDESRAARLLVDAGLVELADSGRAKHTAHADQIPQASSFHRIFLLEQQRQVIELHVDALQLGLRPRCEGERWRRAQPLPRLHGVLMLCPEDQLVQLAVHAHKHGFERLIWIKDLDLLVRRYGASLNWDLVQGTARAEGVLASIWYSLALTAALLGTPMPAGMLRAMQPSALVRALYRACWPATEIAHLQGKRHLRALQFRPADPLRGTLPSLVLMGRRQDRLRAALRTQSLRIGLGRGRMVGAGGH